MSCKIPFMVRREGTDSRRIEDFNKAEEFAKAAAKSGTYLYPIKVGQWLWNNPKYSDICRVSSTC